MKKETLPETQLRSEWVGKISVDTITGIIQDLLSRQWSEEEAKQKLINPKEKLWDWDVEAFIKLVDVNRESSEPYNKEELRIIFDEIEQSITSVRLSELQKHPRKSLAQLLTQSYPETKFILEPFFEQGTVNMISAPPNTWKSWMFFVMASAIASGSPFLEKFSTTKQKVLIVNEEDTERLIAERFGLLGITDQSLDIYFRTAQGSKISPEYCAALLDECKKDGITVIMFDSLRALHDADENSSTAMQPILDNLKTLTREGITVIFTHHHKKKNLMDRGDTSESSRGSSAINAAIFGHISLEEVEKETGTFLVFRHLKSKTTQKLAPFEVRIDREDGVKFEMVGDYDDATRTAEKVKEAVYEVIKKNGFYHWTSIKEILRSGISNEKYVRMSLKGMSTTGILVSKSKIQLEEENPGRVFIGAKNSRFYQISKLEPDEQEENEKDSSAAAGILTGDDYF